MAIGSHLLAAWCASKLASVYCKQRQLKRMEQAVEAATHELESVGSAASLAAQLCHGELAAAAAEAALAAGDAKTAWQRSQAAIREAKQLAATAGGAVSGHAAALHARALLAASACAAAEDNVSSARSHAAAALEATKNSMACSTALFWQAAALVCLAEVAEDVVVPSTLQLAIWGLSPAAASPSPVAKSARGSRGTGRTASRGRSMEATEQPDGDGASPGAGGRRARWLWQALALARELPSLIKRAASLLAEVAGKAGRLHLAALLLHLSLGGAMRLQYRLVLHTKARQLVIRAARGAEVPGSAMQRRELHELLELLNAGLDWQAVQQLGSEADGAPAAPARGKKAVAGGAARATIANAGSQPPNSELLAALDAQAEQALRSWMAALPAGTAVVALGTGCGGTSIVACRLEPGGASVPLLMSLPAHPLSASLSEHPIRALRMDDDESAGHKAAW